ncbi:SH3 domain-containing protein [bacterium]|nr:SH3 domain-containing protein [bacterium]
MKRHMLFCLIIGFLILFAQAVSQSAQVQTKYGQREGRVIARKFDRVVITILTETNQIFQFYVKDIHKITSEKALLVGESTVLREQPSPNGEKLAALVKGLEISILETPDDGKWVKVQAWGSMEGWIPKSTLTKEIVITPPRQQSSPTREFRPITETPADIPLSATLPADATIEKATK